MIIISGIFDVHADDRELLLKAVELVGDASRAEPGCRRYGFSRDLADPNRLHLFEAWESAEALERHFATAHFRDYAAMTGQLRMTRSMMRFLAEELPPDAGPRPS